MFAAPRLASKATHDEAKLNCTANYRAGLEGVFGKDPDQEIIGNSRSRKGPKASGDRARVLNTDRGSPA